LLGDRAYALIDPETGKVVGAKNVKLFPDLLECRAAFVETPRPGARIPPVQITFPNGKSVLSDSGDIDRDLSSRFGRAATLARSAPEDYTVDQYHPSRVAAAAAA
jgi:hypothetical protein